jgi:hypothetical protein
MVLPSFIVALTTLGIVVPPVQGHCMFDWFQDKFDSVELIRKVSFMRLKADGKWQQPLQYIRYC